VLDFGELGFKVDPFILRWNCLFSKPLKNDRFKMLEIVVSHHNRKWTILQLKRGTNLYTKPNCPRLGTLGLR
jgi:hypothetical protein